MNEYPQDFIDEVYNIFYSMEVSSNKKGELVAYQLKDMAQNWYTQWRDNTNVRAGPISWEVFRSAFIDRFFPWEKREVKVEEFINFHQGGKSVLEYFLKFTKLSKYASSSMSKPRDEMIIL